MSSTLLTTESVPLVADTDGVILIEGTRVPIETVVALFEEGSTPEEIAQQYPTIPLGVVYQVAGYYLRHRTELDDYLMKRSQQHAATRAANETRWPSDGIRERLLARRK